MNPLLGQLQQIFQRHPKRIMGGLGAVLLGTGVTAFGVAPLAANVEPPATRLLTEAVQPEALQSTASLEATPAFTLYRSDITRRDDSLATLLRRLGVSDSAAAQFLRTDATAAALLKGPAGKLVSVETDDAQQLQRLTARWLPSDDSSHYSRLTIERQGGQWQSRLESGALTSSVRLSSGTIRSSLFAATDAARLPDNIASQLADLFSADIDFRRDLRAGDRFSVVYEVLEADGEILKHGRLLSAEFVNKGQGHQIVWFQEANQKGGYYNFKGESTRRAFLSSPLAFSRVSSGYGMRFHPISGKEKAHLGTDFAAPTGTPVRTVGDGVVEFAGWKNGYGNFVVVQHRQNKSTAYAHLSRIDVKKGQRVEQGNQIGLVGSTGASTGPHLHFEYLVGKTHQDPLTIARQSESQTIAPASRKAFAALAARMQQQLTAAATVVQASAD